MADVCILMGSASDEEKVAPCMGVLKELGISHTVTVSSAHRTPERTDSIVREAEAAGCKVFICAAGMAAHLAGAMAAGTTLPVIGIPIKSSLDGMDALLATVQMPSGIPVATVAIDGAKNAAFLAAEILALGDVELTEKLEAQRAAAAAEILAKDRALNEA